MSPVSNKPSETSALPPEFSHKALQSLVRKGSTTGSLTGAEVAEAMRAADVRAARGRVVLRALGEQGITVAMDSSTGVAAATSTAKKTVASSRATTSTAAKPAARATTKAAPAKAAATKAAATKAAATKGGSRQGGSRQGGSRPGCPGEDRHRGEERGSHEERGARQGGPGQGNDDPQGRRRGQR